ncbi:F0F1 ATP synthase subunit B [Spiroplasma endosymbiont of Agriotes lineatus]|uniref:F0F1 ATP synthase subunit B n=1 Tax=Spiroplasma endosymbiont of Agriotes lineatus TaxID=3077930 RepID=UPI0030D07ABD
MFLSYLAIFYKIKQENIINQLFPNVWVFITHILATVVLLVVLGFFLYKPFKQLMQKRRSIIKDLIDDAIRKQTQAIKYEIEANSLLKDSKMQSQQIIDDAKAEALTQRQEIINQASIEAGLIDEQSQRDILKERIKAEENIRQEIIDVAFNMAQNILEKEIDREQNEVLIDDFIKQLD